MIHQIRIVILFLLFHCLPAAAQLTFRIDSLVCLCYGEYDKYADNTWESKELLRRGPDILVHGTITNESDGPIILEIIESADDTLIIHKELSLFVSYHYKKDYHFAHDPWIVSDYISYPFWGGIVLPKKTITHDGERVSYSIIRAGESIPLAFETLAIPSSAVNPAKSMDPISTKDKKKAYRYQKRSAEAIKSSIKVIPIVQDYEDSDALSNLLLEKESQQPEEDAEYDFESSIPQGFLDKMPYYKDGGKNGFYRWLKEELEKDKLRLSGEGYNLLICFVVGKEGNVVYSKVSSIQPKQVYGTIGSIINDVLLNSPEWEAGVFHGKKIDTRISLSLSIDHDGNVVDLSLLDLNSLFDSSNELPSNEKMGYYNNPSAHVIDEYKLFSHNCTTTVSDVLNSAGSSVLKGTVNQPTGSIGIYTYTSIPVTHTFVNPRSLQHHLKHNRNIPASYVKK